MAIGIIKNGRKSANGSSRWTPLYNARELLVGNSLSLESLPSNYSELYVRVKSDRVTTSYASYALIPREFVEATDTDYNYMYASGGNHSDTSPNGCIIKYCAEALGVHLYYRNGNIVTAYVDIYYR